MPPLENISHKSWAQCSLSCDSAEKLGSPKWEVCFTFLTSFFWPCTQELSVVVRLAHLVLELQLKLEDGVLLRERLSSTLALENWGQVVVTLVVVLGTQLQEEVSFWGSLILRRRNLLRRSHNWNLDRRQRPLPCLHRRSRRAADVHRIGQHLGTRLCLWTNFGSFWPLWSILTIFVVNFEPHREEVGVLGVASGARPGIPPLVKN